jgi:hypothetical protein
MGKDWIADLLKQRELRQQEGARQVQLETAALDQIPAMFKRLSAQVQRDVQRYSEGTGNRVRCQITPNKCEVNADLFPFFWLCIEPGKSGIKVSQTSKKSSSSQPNELLESEVLIISKRQDENYYRIEGYDHASEADVSEHLLRPLLEQIESR